MFTLKQSALPFSKYLNAVFFASFAASQTTKEGLHPYLEACLKKNKFTKLTSIQCQSIEHVQNGENAIITSETGSGKTLCYVIPILDRILKEKEGKDQTAYQAISSRGAIILVPTKELAAQVYSVIRSLDTQNKIEAVRAGSLAFVAPSIEQSQAPKEATQLQNQKKKNSDQHLNSTNLNVVRNISWKTTDIFITTPTQLVSLLALKDKTNPYQVDPKFVVMDEFDLLLGDTNIARSSIGIIDRFLKKPRDIKSRQLSPVQFILAGASFPLKIGKKSGFEYLDNTLKPVIIESDNFYKISPKMKHDIVRVEESLANNPSYTQFDILTSIVRKSVSKRIIVFCGSGETTLQIAENLRLNGLSALPFHSKLSTELRQKAMSEFDSGTVRILVSTDLGARGLDFNEVDHVIQYDFAQDALSFLHRVGRTCRMNREGLVTSFLKETDMFLYQQVNKLVSHQKRIDPIVSRKRSLSKSNKKNNNSEEELSEEEE